MLKDYLLRWQNLPIAVIGDLILDEYLEGNVERISPEAPVPIHHVYHTHYRAGGAANVAINLQGLGTKPMLFGVCGNDEAKSLLEEQLRQENIHTDHVLVAHDRPTTRKTRVYAKNQQLIRIDWEEKHDIDLKLQDSLLKKLTKQEFKAIILSDYQKGLLTSCFIKKIIKFAKNKKIPVVIDPKISNFNAYEGATLLTPNRQEAYLALGIDKQITLSPEHIVESLLRKYSLTQILVTLGADGMIYGYFEESHRKVSSQYFPADTKEVFDVSGAGDTVVSLMTASCAANIKMETAAKLANIAAGFVVQKWGTHPIRSHELAEAFNKVDTHLIFPKKNLNKIRSLPKLLRELAKFINSKIVFTNGCFDILHAGHIEYLRQAKGMGDILIVALNSDESIIRLKGENRPIQPLVYRQKVLESIEYVDYILPFHENTPLKVIQKIRPDILVKGGDWLLENIVGRDIVEENGGQIVTIPVEIKTSTSKIISHILKDYKHHVNTCNT